jgi:hypothetical protein
MWTSEIARDDFITLAQGEPLRNLSLRGFDSLSHLKPPMTGLLAVWAEKPDQSNLPNVLLMPSKDKKDFFAWANSYLKIKPITAFVRVVDFEVLESLDLKPKDQDRWLRAIIGLVLTEALTYLEQSTAKLSLRACEGTYSFAVGKSLLQVQGVKGVTHTGRNWFRSREALGNKSSRLALFHLQGVWSVIVQLIDSSTSPSDVPPVIITSCRHLFETGELTDADWRELTKDTHLYDLRLVMQDIREERVRLLEEFLRSLSTQSRENIDMAFLVGYLVSMIAPGTLDHWRLLASVKTSIPTVGLWYGLCVGLRPANRLLSYGSGLGRLIERELHRKVDILEQPTCDIDVEELDVTGPFFKAEFGLTGNTIEVEVSPGVSVPFRLNGTDQSTSEFRLQSTMPPSTQEPSIDPVTIEILDDAIYALQDVRLNLQKAIPYSQRGFYKKPKKKRPAR